MEIPLADAGPAANRARVVAGRSQRSLIFQASEIWLASHRLDSEKIAVMERGAALVPGDGSAWDRLGRLRQWDFVDSDLPGAIEDLPEGGPRGSALRALLDGPRERV